MKRAFCIVIGFFWLTMPVQAKNTKFFIGANYSVANVSFNSELEQTMQQLFGFEFDDFQVFGAEAGVKFFASKKSKVSVGGSVAYDWSYDEAIKVQPPYNQIISDIAVGFSTLSFMSDAYYNTKLFNNATNGSVLLGLGYASVDARAEMGVSSYVISEKISSDAIVFKLGMSTDLAYGFSMHVAFRYFRVTDKEFPVKDLSLFGAGLRYSF